jgi:signal transduction histidine kinase
MANNMKRSLLLLFFVICNLYRVTAQDKEQLIALQQELAQATTDTSRIAILRKMVIGYRAIDVNQSITWAREGIALATRIGDKKKNGMMRIALANTHMSVNDFENASKQLDTALVLFREAKDKKGTANAMSNYGAVCQRASKPVEAIRYFFEAYKMAEEANDSKVMFSSTFNIAIIYSDQENGKKALEYSKKALAIAEKAGDSNNLGKATAGVAESYRLCRDTLNAQLYFEKAVNILEQLGDEQGVAAALTNWALVMNDINREIEFQLRAQQYWDESGIEDVVVVANLSNLGWCYFTLFKKDTLTERYGNKSLLLQKAESYTLRSLQMADRVKNMAYKVNGLHTLANIQYARKEYKQAYESLMSYVQINATAYSQDTKNQIATLESQRKIAIRDKEIQISKLALRDQRRQNIALITGLCLLLVIGGLLYRQARTRKKVNHALQQLNYQLDEANKAKAGFLGIMSHDLRSPVSSLLSFLRLRKEAPDLLSKEAAAAYENKIANSAEHLLETLENLLLWSKGQMANFKPRIEKVKIASLFAEIKKHFSAEDRVRILFEYPEGITVNTDPEYLKTIMRNLTDNAIKALAHTDDPLIRWKAAEQQGKTILSITDNGPGVTAEQLQTLYNKDADVSARHGLGFHLVRDMAGAIGCAITVNAAPAEGTTFSLHF